MAEKPKTIREWLMQIDSKLDSHVELDRLHWNAVDELDKTLNGNGRMGIKSKVNIMFWVLGILAGAAAIAFGAVATKSLGI